MSAVICGALAVIAANAFSAKQIGVPLDAMLVIMEQRAVDASVPAARRVLVARAVRYGYASATADRAQHGAREACLQGRLGEP